MEKKKLLLISVSVGLFLIVVVGACILVFSPKKYPDSLNLDDLAIAPGVRVGTQETKPITEQNTPASTLIEGQQADPANPAITVNQPSSTVVAAPQRVENVIYINGEDANTAVRVERLNDGPTKTYITIPNPGNQKTETVQTTGAVDLARAVPAKETLAVPENSVAAKPAAPKPAAPKAVPAAPAKTAAKPAAVSTAAPAKKMPTKMASVYWVQTGSFSKKAGADSVKQYLASKQITSVVMDGNVNGRTYYRVRVGPYTTPNEAEYWLTLIKSIDGMEDSQIWKSKS